MHFWYSRANWIRKFVNTVAEIEQLMEKDHFSVDTIADLPVEESPEVPINEGNEGDVTISSQDQPTSSEELETSLPVDAATQSRRTHSIPRSLDAPLIVLAIHAGSYSRLDARTG